MKSNAKMRWKRHKRRCWGKKHREMKILGFEIDNPSKTLINAWNAKEISSQTFDMK